MVQLREVSRREGKWIVGESIFLISTSKRKVHVKPVKEKHWLSRVLHNGVIQQKN